MLVTIGAYRVKGSYHDPRYWNSLTRFNLELPKVVISGDILLLLKSIPRIRTCCCRYVNQFQAAITKLEISQNYLRSDHAMS